MVRKPERCDSYTTRLGDDHCSCVICGWSEAAHRQVQQSTGDGLIPGR